MGGRRAVAGRWARASATRGVGRAALLVRLEMARAAALPAIDPVALPARGADRVAKGAAARPVALVVTVVARRPNGLLGRAAPEASGGAVLVAAVVVAAAGIGGVRAAAARKVGVGGAPSGAVGDGAGGAEAVCRGVRAPASARDADRENVRGAAAYGSGGVEAYAGAAGVGGPLIHGKHGHGVKLVAGRPRARLPRAVARVADRRRRRRGAPGWSGGRPQATWQCKPERWTEPERWPRLTRRGSEVAGARCARVAAARNLAFFGLQGPATACRGASYDACGFTNSRGFRVPCSNRAGA